MQERVAGTQDFGLGIKSWKTTALVWAGAVFIGGGAFVAVRAIPQAKRMMATSPSRAP
ncbi:hypothetical protein AGR1A_Cc40393 [Agrobacterium fabacearum CFBP 5771]|nr:hypothetical protein AGR1A_Cc40393 [Agrobacterium fabacearum CFBP 5771]